MNALDGIGMIGEVLSWVGLLVGLPLLVIGLMVRIVQGDYVSTPVAVLDDLDDEPMALWTVEQRTFTRGLSAHEAARVLERTPQTGYVSVRDPEQMRVDRRQAFERASTTIGIVMLGAAVVGFLVSLLPVLIG